MFNNVIVSASGATITTKWTWNYTRGGPIPHCKYFYCSVKGDVLLDKSLFLEREVLEYFESQILNISEKTRFNDLETYYITHRDKSHLIECELKHGDSISKEMTINVDNTKEDQVFYICIYDDHHFTAKVIFACGNNKIEVKKTPAGFLRPYHTIEILNPDERRKVLRTKQNGTYIYSVLPRGYSQFYFEKDVDIKTIDIQYLSTLMGTGR